MNGFYIVSPNTTFAIVFNVAAAAIVIGLIVAAPNASTDDVSPVTQHDAAANAAAPPATNYFPSPYVLNAIEATPHIEAF